MHACKHTCVSQCSKAEGNWQCLPRVSLQILASLAELVDLVSAHTKDEDLVHALHKHTTLEPPGMLRGANRAKAVQKSAENSCMHSMQPPS
eukprot:1137818-Pelagomonas_calceolata.AAC.2